MAVCIAVIAKEVGARPGRPVGGWRAGEGREEQRAGRGACAGLGLRLALWAGRKGDMAGQRDGEGERGREGRRGSAPGERWAHSCCWDRGFPAEPCGQTPIGLMWEC